MKHLWVLAAVGVLSLSLPVLADDECPAAVKTTVEKAFPGSIMKKCKSETEHGKQMFEVKLKTKDGDTTRMDLDAAGLVLLTQQALATEAVPVVVMKSFQDKHKDYKVVRTEKWTYPDGKVTYRVTYLGDAGKKSSVFYTSNGVLVEQTETTIKDLDED